MPEDMVSVAPAASVSLDSLESQIPHENGEAPKQETAPIEPEKVQAPAPDPLAELKAEMERRIGEETKKWEQLKRENGQFRKQLQSLSTQPKQITPTALDQLDPAQRKQVEDMLQAVIDSKYGDRFTKYDSIAETLQQQQEKGEFVSAIQSFAGTNYATLEPVMADLLNSAAKAAESGDESALSFLSKVKNAPELLAMYAEKLHGQNVATKAETARETQAANAKRAANTLSNSPKAPSSTGIPTRDQAKSMSLAELEKLIPHEAD